MNRVYIYWAAKSSVPPTIENDNDKPLVAYKGDNFTYDCRILKPKLQDRVVHYAWGRYKGVDGDNLLVDFFEFSERLTFINLTEADEGQYVCYVTNQENRDLKIFNLTVLTRQEDPGEILIGLLLHDNVQ